MRKITLALVGTLLITQAISQPTASSIQGIVAKEAGKFMATDGAVGVAIGIYKDGRTHTYYYGRVEKGNTERPKSSSIFNIASLSKTFTGLLLAQAVVGKKVKLDDDIRKYLVGNYPNLEYNKHPIQLSHLVSHVSGLPFFLSDSAERPGYSRTNFFDDLHAVRLDTIPGIRFKYSNAAVQLLCYILERVYEKTFEELLYKKITLPLDMKRTKITLSIADKKSVAKGYNKDGSYNPEAYNYMLGAGGIKSSASDLLKYIEFQLTDKDDPLRLTHQEVWGFDMSSDKHYSFGLGWQIIRDTNGNRRISQDGNLSNYSCVIIFCPELRTGIVILCNSFMMDPLGAMANAILKEVAPGIP